MILKQDIKSKDKGIYATTFPDYLKLLHQGIENYIKIKVGDAGLLKGKDGDIDSRLKESTRQAQVASRDYIEIGRWIDLEGIQRDYDIREDLNAEMPGHKQDSSLGTEWHKYYPPKEILKEYRQAKDFMNWFPVKEQLFEIVDKIITSKSSYKKSGKVKLRKVQARVINAIKKLMLKYGINVNIIADLAPRFGKTLTFLMLFKYLNKDYGHRIMTIPVYWLSSLTSFVNELKLYRDFENMEYVNKNSGDLNKIIPKLLKEDKLVIVGVSLHDEQKDFELKYKFLSRYKDKILSVEDEADFGNHTPAQQSKLNYLYKSAQITKIKMSGTNVGRMSAGWKGEDIHGLISIPYSMIEQDPDCIKNGVVLRKYFEMIMSKNLYSKVENYDPNIIPTWTKLMAKARANREYWSALGKDIYGYEPIYGMNIDQAANDQIKYSMIFTSGTKAAMKQIKEIWDEDLNKHHIVVIDGDTTSNAEAEQMVKNEINYMRIGHIKKDKLIIITNMMGSRSFSVPEIQATLFFKDGGSIDTFIQQNQRDKTPNKNKKFGYTFDFAFDPNKLQNVSLSIIHEAKQVSKELGLSVPESVRYIFNSLNLTRIDEFKPTIKNADSVLADWEDDNKILSVADESADVQAILSDPALLDIMLNVNTDVKDKVKKKIKEKMPKGKTYGFQKTVSKSEQNEMLKVLKKAIKSLNRSATTCYHFSKGKGTTFKECIDVIEKNIKISDNFKEMFGIEPSQVKKILPYLAEHFLDICINNSIKDLHGTERR